MYAEMHAYRHYAHVPTSLSHKTESIVARYISFDLDLEKREFGHKAKAANWKNKYTKHMQAHYDVYVVYVCMYAYVCL